MRTHPFEFRLEPGEGRQMRGSLTLTVCRLGPGVTASPDPVSDEDKPKIRIESRARYDQASAESVSYNGQFKIVGGTQRYEDLSGSGTIGGYLACFPSSTPAGCTATNGRFLDGQMTLQGRYSDPTPQL